MERTRRGEAQACADRPILAGILVVAAALRLFHLGVQSLWYDEGYSVYLAGKSLAELTIETASDIQPPLYYYLLHFWMLIFGRSEVAVRSLSLLLGVLSIPLFYWLGRRVFSREVGLLAAGLATLSPLYVWYAQEARMYTLLVALTLSSCYLLWSALENASAVPRRWAWAGVALSAILALYTHYFAVFILAFQAAYVISAWLLRWHPPRVREGLLALLAVIVAYLPWLPFLFGRYEADVSYWEGRLKLDEAVRKIGIVFSGGESVVEATGQWLALGLAVVAVVCLLAVVLLWPRQGDKRDSVPAPAPLQARVAFLLLYLLLPVVLLLITTYWTPKFNPRYAMIASPPLYILLTAGWVALWRERHSWARALVCLTAAFSALVMVYADYNAYFDIRFTRPDFRGAVQWVEEHRSAGEGVILTSGHAYPVFGYYYRGDDWLPLPEERTLSTTDTLNYSIAAELNRFLEGKRGVWLVLWQDEVADPNGYLPMLLDQYAEPEPVEGAFYHVRLRHYRLPDAFHVPEAPDIRHPLDVNLGNALTLVGYSPAVTQTLNLYWEAREPLAEDFKISLRMKDPTGFNWTRPDSDRRLAALLYPTMRWRPGELVIGHYVIPALPGTPPGTYDLEALVYAEGAPQALDVLDAQGAPRGKVVRLGPVTLNEPVPATRADVSGGESAVTWPGELAMIGYQQDRLDAQAGDEIHLTLFWEALAPVATDYALRLSWVQDGVRLAEQTYHPAGAAYPTSAWKPGDLLRGQYSLDVPLDIAAGRGQIELGLFAPGAPLPHNEWFPLAEVNIEQTDRIFEPPAMQLAIDAAFADQLSLLGANLPAVEVEPGSALDLSLFWREEQRMETSYTVFVHVLDQNGAMLVQEDRIPAAGSRPTTGWVPGEIVEDVYRLAIGPDANPGDYVVEVGVYDAGDPAFPRLSVVDMEGRAVDDRVIVAHVTVRR